MHVQLGKDGFRRVVEIAQITGRVESERVEIETLYRWDGGGYEKGLAG